MYSLIEMLVGPTKECSIGLLQHVLTVETISNSITLQV